MNLSLLILYIFCGIIVELAMTLKIGVVTGANKGIGLEIAKKLGAAGVRTILACRDEALGSKAVEDLKSIGYDVEFRRLDISSSASIATFVEGVTRDYPSIDILVNNAAIAFKGSDPTPFTKQASPTINVNFFGTVELTEHLLPLLKKSTGARIVNVASMAGHLKILPSKPLWEMFTSSSLTVDTLKGLMSKFILDVEAGRHAAEGWPNTCYGMSKLGLIAYTKVLARLEPTVSVNCCCPGYCATDMSSHRGTSTAEQGARTPAMLALSLPSDQTGKFYSSEVEIQW